MIGDCGLTLQNINGQIKPEIGYHIAKAYQHRGYAKEAARSVRDWAFENTDFDTLYSYMKATNLPSIATAKANGMILCFLAVDPIFRRQHIAEEMFRFILPQMNGDKPVTVTTYREGVPEGIAARAFYQKLGFVPGKLTVEFGSEVQEFVLHRL